jgi:hypothetical protein
MEDEMGWICIIVLCDEDSTYVILEYRKFKGRVHLVDLGVVWKVIVMRQDVDWIQVVEDGTHWRAVVDMIIDPGSRIPVGLVD